MSAAEDKDIVEVAKTYYDSSEADEFYFNVWGGEDIHVGLYEPPDLPVRQASRATVEKMASMLPELGKGTKVLDLGAGYGGAARYLASEFGAQVTCLNLSETQNRRNREITEKAGLADRIEVLQGNFEELALEDGTFDVVWSQDSFLHSDKRAQVLKEARRVLKPGGTLIFTDPMQADDCPQGVLTPVLERIHLSSLASFAFYEKAGREVGLEPVELLRLTHQLGRHYGRVREELSNRYDEMVKLSTQPYVDRMLAGLQHWVDGEAKGYLAWGILKFKAV